MPSDVYIGTDDSLRIISKLDWHDKSTQEGQHLILDYGDSAIHMPVNKARELLERLKGILGQGG